MGISRRAERSGTGGSVDFGQLKEGVALLASLIVAFKEGLAVLALLFLLTAGPPLRERIKVRLQWPGILRYSWLLGWLAATVIVATVVARQGAPAPPGEVVGWLVALGLLSYVAAVLVLFRRGFGWLVLLAVVILPILLTVAPIFNAVASSLHDPDGEGILVITPIGVIVFVSYTVAIWWLGTGRRWTRVIEFLADHESDS
jgi:hypothetical protein